MNCWGNLVETIREPWKQAQSNPLIWDLIQTYRYRNCIRILPFNLPIDWTQDTKIIWDLPLPKEGQIPNNLVFAWGSYKWNKNKEILQAICKTKVQVIDTAETYGFGSVEKELRKNLSSLGYMGTVFHKVSKNHLSPKAIKGYCERQKKWELPVFHQIHWPNKKFDFTSVVKEMEGCFGSFGVCNFSVGLYQLAKRISKNILSLQISFGPHEPLNKFLLPYYWGQGIKTVFSHSTLGQGRFMGRSEEIIKEIKALRVCPIIGGNNPVHLEENKAAFGKDNWTFQLKNRNVLI